MLRRLYDWTISLAQHPRAVWALAFISFIEASFFPIPPDVLLIAMVVAIPSRAFYYAAVATISSVLGGLLGYAIGAFAFDTVGSAILHSFGMSDSMADFNERYNSYGVWLVLIGGWITPLPYKVITIMSGWTGLNLTTFIVASIMARAGRFFLVAVLLWKFGAPIRDFIERRLALMFTLGIALILVGFWAATKI